VTTKFRKKATKAIHVDFGVNLEGIDGKPSGEYLSEWEAETEEVLAHEAWLNLDGTGHFHQLAPDLGSDLYGQPRYRPSELRHQFTSRLLLPLLLESLLQLYLTLLGLEQSMVTTTT
jgi:hypothetical protein